MLEIFEEINKKIENGLMNGYAVFDFDKTCLNNDIEEIVYMYQAEHFLYNMDEKEFSSILRISHQLLDKNIEKDVIKIEDKILELYHELVIHPCYSEDHLHTFFKYMCALLEIANDQCDTHFAYRWVLYFLKAFSKEEVTIMACHAIKHHLSINRTPILSHASLLEPLNVQPSLHQGASINKNTYEIMKYLFDHQITPYIVSASCYEVVLAGILSTDYNQLISSDRILGLDVHLDEKLRIPTIKEGKEKAIQELLFPLHHNQNPILAAGDSTGDFWMMKMMGDSGIRVVIGESEKLLTALKDNHLSYFQVETTK